MAIEKWSGVSAWADAITPANVNSLASDFALLSDLPIANDSGLHMFADVSLVLASITPTGGAPRFGIYLYPLSDNNVQYGDGRFIAAALGPPPAAYFKGAIPAQAAAGAIYGQLTGIVIPPGAFKFVLHNALGIVLASSGNSLKYRTYNRQVV